MPMRPVRQRLSAAGVAPWIPLNRYSSTIAIALGVIFSTNKNLTAEVQYVTDPLVSQPCSISRSTTTATLTLTNHGLAVGDSVVVTGWDTLLDGVYAVGGVTNENVITFTVADVGATGSAGARVIPLRVQVHPTLTALTADAVGNFAYPPTACRLAVTSYTAGYVDLDVVSGGK